MIKENGNVEYFGDDVIIEPTKEAPAPDPLDNFENEKNIAE